MQNLSNNQLYELCKEYGKRALRARQKFTGLLPEVLKRRLYEKKGYSSIYEFSAKLAGISKEQVNRVICLERRLENLPALKIALIEGEISSHKLERIATIATAENQNEILEKAMAMPIRVLETYIKDIKRDDSEAENIIYSESLFAENPAMVSINSTANHSLIKSGNKDGFYMAKTNGEHVGANVFGQDKARPEANLEFGEKPQVGADLWSGAGQFARGKLSSSENVYGSEHSPTGVISETGGIMTVGADSREIGKAKLEGKVSPKELLENLQALNLNRSTIQRLTELKSKGFDLDELINELLDKRESEIAEELAEYVDTDSVNQVATAEQNESPTQERNRNANTKPDSFVNGFGTPINASRHIPQKVRQILNRQYGTKCAIPGCGKESRHIHHTNRFAISHVHNPYYMAPLCAEHHKLAHLLDHRFKEKIFAP